MSCGARLGDCVLQGGVFYEADVMHGVSVNEILELAMMGSVWYVPHVESMLCFASRGGHGQMDLCARQKAWLVQMRYAWFMHSVEARNE